MRVLSPVTRQTTESLWNLGRRGFKHLRRKRTKIVSHCRASKSQRVGTTGFPPFCRSSRLKPCSAINFCKQATVARANGGFQNPGVCPQAFPSFLSPTVKYRSGSVPWSSFAPQPHGNACFAGYCQSEFQYSIVQNLCESK